MTAPAEGALVAFVDHVRPIRGAEDTYPHLGWRGGVVVFPPRTLAALVAPSVEAFVAEWDAHTGGDPRRGLTFTVPDEWMRASKRRSSELKARFGTDDPIVIVRGLHAEAGLFPPADPLLYEPPYTRRGPGEVDVTVAGSALLLDLPYAVVKEWENGQRAAGHRGDLALPSAWRSRAKRVRRRVRRELGRDASLPEILDHLAEQARLSARDGTRERARAVTHG